MVVLFEFDEVPQLVLLQLQLPLQGGIRAVPQGIGDRSRLDEGAHLLVIAPGGVIVGHPAGDHHPQGAVVGDGKRLGPVLHPVLHQNPGQVVSRAGDVVVAAPLAGVDLKGLEFPVPLVVLDVEVGKAGKVQGLQEEPEFFTQLVVGLGDDDGVIADAVGGMLLQEHVAQAHEPDLGVGAGVAGEHPHKAVVPGDELLNDHGVGVPGGVDPVQGGLQSLPGGEAEHLLAAGEIVLPVGHAVGGLTDVRGAEGELEVMAHLPAVDEGAGVVDAELVAQLIEFLLVGEPVHQIVVDVGGDHVGGELIPVAGRQLHIAVAAADDQHRLVRVLPGIAAHVLEERGPVLILGADPVVQNGALIAHAGGELAVGGGPDAVGLMKGPGHAVHVDIPAEQEGQEGCLHQFSAPRKVISYQLLPSSGSMGRTTAAKCARIYAASSPVSRSSRRRISPPRKASAILLSISIVGISIAP